MTFTSEPCHTGGMFMVIKFKKEDEQNLTLMTLDQEPCQLVPRWLINPFGALSQWWCVYGSIGL